MKENSIEELKQTLEELYRTQKARLDVGADDLDIREKIAEVEEEIKELQDETMEEDSIKNGRSSIEEDIILLKDFTEGNFKRDKLENYKGSYKMGCFYYKDIQRAIEHIISDYKRVLKENEILKKEKEQAWEEWNNLEQGSYETEQKLKQQIKESQRENEELKEDRNNNYQMIVLAQNEALGYMQGYEDGKKLKRSAVQNIIENQQYYIFQKQIEKYEEHIEKLQKENEKALAEYMKWQKQELEQKDKIIDLMAETINNHDIDEDLCKQMGKKANCNEFEDTEKCKECIKQYFINKAKEI